MGTGIRTTMVAVLALLALTALAPGVAIAQGVFLAGPITDIDDGDVKAAGASNRFVVKDRHVFGALFGMLNGEQLTAVPFTFTFGTNVPIMTQSGNLHGLLAIGSAYEARVAAKSSIGVTPVPCTLAPPGAPCLDGFVPGLIIEGVLTFTAGAIGTGTVSAWVIPNIDPATGHIIGVLAGALTISQ